MGNHNKHGNRYLWGGVSTWLLFRKNIKLGDLFFLQLKVNETTPLVIKAWSPIIRGRGNYMDNTTLNIKIKASSYF